MSDPLKTTDIEDVLSSIRRLVSEEARPKQASTPMPDRGKLVLTPALRVSEPDRQDGTPEAGGSTDDLTLGLGAEVDETPDNALPEAENAAADVDPPVSSPETLEWEDHQSKQPETLTDETPGPEPESEPQDQTAAQAQSSDEPETQEWSGTLYDAADAHVPHDDAEVPDEHAPRAMPEKPMLDQPETDEDSHFDFLAEDDGMIDEEALRELVAEIVRQELQGALGERITRNVRKLVRREIHRAMSAQEFD